MTFRYPKWLAFLKFAAALLMLIALYVGTSPKYWGWLLFLPLFITLVVDGVLTYRYSLTVDGDRISLASYNSAQYRVSDITAINVWFAKGGRIAVVTFSDQRRLSFPSRLVEFDKLVELLRTQAKLPESSPGY
jgi:hypothetical protein